MSVRTHLLGACGALALLAAPALAADPAPSAPQPPLQSRTAPAADWISLTGTVAAIDGNRLTLATGEGSIEVGLRGLAAADAGRMQPGDRIGVTGRMDSNVFERRRIAAESIYVARLNRLLGADDWVIVTGRVVAKTGDDFTLESGDQRLEVDADDDAGAADVRALEVGDRVSVTGELDEAGLYSRREIDATSVIVLTPPPGAS
ncbi:exported hypothetical protein [uncultured Alphaproteobacteria bacterium]|uniref:DUF5666 domain-containing protein n=1 Tax=uncultured Alphaproteobacteria bacterium TaxID=91750 RepID=A0A212KKM2_9PROT|nr:exported hypothetical protein [uncultured Alphaproteobacteria bacterium]